MRRNAVFKVKLWQGWALAGCDRNDINDNDMKAGEFPEVNARIAENQEEYMTLPAHVDTVTEAGFTTCCWELSWRERLRLLRTGRLWHQIMTFHMPLQPQLLSVTKPPLVLTPKNGEPPAQGPKQQAPADEKHA